MTKRLVVGAIAGVVGTWAMNEAQRLWTHAVDGGLPPESAGGRHDARDWQERSEGQNSNELAAQALARHILGRGLTRQELRVAAPALHYLFGAAMGAVYGMSSRRSSQMSGAAFGTTVWLAADEIAMPLLGLSQSTARRPLEMHVQALVAHLVFGAATAMTHRSLQAHFEA